MPNKQRSERALIFVEQSTGFKILVGMIYKCVIYRNSENTDTSATAATAASDSETNEGKH